MAGLHINRITNANIYLDGNNFVGRAESVELGELNPLMEEFSALGMEGRTEFASGFEKLEGKIVWGSLYADAAILAANPYRSVALQCLSSVKGHTSAGLTDEVSLAWLLTVTFKGYQLGTYKAGEATKYESKFTTQSVRQMKNGREVLMYDVLNNIYRVDGVDMLARTRANMGM